MPKGLADLAELPVTVLKGVGPERAKTLEKIDIETVLDLVTHYPRRYIDKTKQSSIRDLRVDESSWVFGRVVSSTSVPGRGRGKARTELRITDGSGYLRITFFNQPWRTRQLPGGLRGDVLRQGHRVPGPAPDGQPRDRPPRRGRPAADRRHLPAVRQAHASTRRSFRGWVGESLRRTEEFVDPVPGWVLDQHDFVDRNAALRSIHQPETMREAEEARRRLVFDELLRIQLALVLRKRRIEETSQGIEHVTSGALVERFLDRLPFELTGDQQKVIAEITADLARPIPMHRLLQGDVGAGKTVVAIAALLTAVQGGHQGAFMAPTEVLAEQHFASMRPCSTA